MQRNQENQESNVSESLLTSKTEAQMEDIKIGHIGTPCEVKIKKNVF